jgi:adenylate cyclase
MKSEISVKSECFGVPSPSPTRLIKFDKFTLDLGRGALQSGHRDIQLRPKTFALLKLLVENAGRLVAKDEIVGAIWPNVAVTENSVLQCVKELRRALGEDGTQLITTVPRRGFRLEATAVAELPASPPLAEVSPELHLPSQSAAIPCVSSAEVARAPRPWFPTAFCLLALALAVLWHFASHERANTRLAKPSIAVSPFASNERDHDALAHRITDHIIHALSFSRNLTVIPRAADTGGDQSFKYIVKGSVRPVGRRIRVVAELVDVHSGQVLWVGRFDHAIADVPEVQHQISSEVVGRLVIRIGQAEQQRMQTPAAAYLEAYDHVMSYGQTFD